MKICHLTHNYPRNQGDYSGFFIKDLVSGISKRDVSITVIAPHASDTSLYEKHDNLEIIRFRYSNREDIAYTGRMHEFLINPLNWFKFFNFFKNFYTAAKSNTGINDIIHSHWLIPGGIIGYFIKSRIKIISLHGTDVRLLQKFPFSILGKIILKKYDLIIPVSEYLKSIIGHWCPDKDYYVLPIIGNLDRFIGNPVQKIKHPLSIVTISRISKQKNIEVALRAIKILKSKNIDLQYTIIGDGENRVNLENLVQKYNIDKNVNFLGKIDHERIPDILKKYDIFLLPSKSEGFGISLLEARLSGRIVVCSNSGGLKDLVEDNITGFTFPADSEVKLSEILMKIHNEEKKSVEIAEISYKKTVKNYKYKIQLKRWMNIYFKS